MPPSLQEFIVGLKSRYSHLQGRIGVAVSGGADSVFLLHALHQAGLAGLILHVNHQLRAAESDEDEAFVTELSRSLDLPISTFRDAPPEGNTEQEARNSRYAFFREAIGQGLCEAVATGHTLDDQAETVLSRFLRGAGTAGLAAILPEAPNRILRPLLDLQREAVRAWLSELRIPWREDSSNLDTRFLRNRIRLEVMPSLLQLNPSLPVTLGSTAEWAQGEEDYWRQELDRLAADHLIVSDSTVLVETSRLRALHIAVERRLLRRAVGLVRGSLRQIDFAHIEAIRSLTCSKEGSGRVQLPGLDVYRSFDWLRLAPPGHDSRLERDFEVVIRSPGLTQLPERRLAVEVKAGIQNHVYNSDLHAIDPAKVTGDLLLRNWRPGDNLRVRGTSGAEKIKTLFQEHRIPLWERSEGHRSYDIAHSCHHPCPVPSALLR